MPRGPVFTALAAFTAGSIAGYVIAKPPVIPASCLRAHFLERKLSFEVAQLDIPVSSSSSSKTAPLRAAAPVEPAPIAESSASSEESPAPSPSSTSSETSSADSASSSASSQSETSSSSSSSATSVDAAFPAFEYAVFPVARTPNWGAMKSADEWNRSYEEMKRSDFVRIPSYDMDVLTTPMKELLKERDDADTVRALTAKLFYSTRFFGTYDLDEGEFTGDHAGIDLKVPEGTPVAAIAGGKVSNVIRNASGLGLHVIIEHRIGDESFYSIYGHLSAVSVREGQDVAPGQMIALSGSTGRSTAAHLHLQVDRGQPNETAHEPYWPGDVPTKTEAARHTVNPMSFIEVHAR
jgi:murein DD-endopeptidase MepM/ murein hydrolase activator NlpD